MMQQRVLLLRGLRERLARALSELTKAAGLLRVGDRLLAASAPGQLPYTMGTRGTAMVDSASVGFAAAAAAVAAERLTYFPSTRKQGEQESVVMKVIEDDVRTAVRGMTAALEGLLSYAGYDIPEKPVRTSSGELNDQSLFLEIRGLLDLLRLQPHAVHALGLAPEPVQQPVPAESAAATSATPFLYQMAAIPAAAVPPPPSAASREPATPAVEAAGGSSSSSGASSSRPMGLHVASGGDSAAAALRAARRAAALAGPLVPLPATARMPSRWKRHWLRYCATGGVLLYGGMYLVRHSRLAGSDDLDRWILTVVSAVRSALRTHVVEPLAAVRDELFRTFRDRPAIVSPKDFSLSPALPGDVGLGAAGASSGDGSGSGTAGGDEVLAAGMAVLMRSYEAELRNPLRNLILGDLARALLIQVQHVKVDGEAAMLRLDQILRANELSLSLMAALPALGISLAVVVFSEVTALYASADRTSRFSEWRQLYGDLLTLAAPAPSRELLATHQRMMRTYSVFQR
ncbi:thioredoxin-like protein [Volvox carteri f. nagariensis]|uniref:Thioredoxin-like protein n=1 Tax=Volvox carteri f. nagariensis TaxID=3068 RepID=D8UCX8_VOLCA|nr:thioredoxin-like protein [Volvox carteri f. nagariensis]EFJ42419.1 thioredoxin-like protein [Volvox carteri f. nagariensis]|eukprot:XP_002956482.1 thioredoxin-like protein [Volvox carteri f. nagariensis]